MVAKPSPRDSSLPTASSIRAAVSGIEPTAEREDASRVHRLRNQREFAFDARFGIGAVPYDDDLRFTGQKLLTAVEFGACAVEIGAKFALALRVTAAGRGHHGREQRDDDDERRHHAWRQLGVQHVEVGGAGVAAVRSHQRREPEAPPQIPAETAASRFPVRQARAPCIASQAPRPASAPLPIPAFRQKRESDIETYANRRESR